MSGERNIPTGEYDDVILIALDTLRADYMSCYGYGLKTTPGIDEFAREAVLFESCIASAIPTPPGYTTIFTGVSPSGMESYLIEETILYHMEFH